MRSLTQRVIALPRAVPAQASALRPTPIHLCVSQPGHRTRGRVHPLFASSQDGRQDGEASEEEVLDVAVVGAGPAGLALAIGLLAKGLRVRVFEAAPEIKERGAAVFMQVS